MHSAAADNIGRRRPNIHPSGLPRLLLLRLLHPSPSCFFYFLLHLAIAVIIGYCDHQILWQSDIVQNHLLWQVKLLIQYFYYHKVYCMCHFVIVILSCEFGAQINAAHLTIIVHPPLWNDDCLKLPICNTKVAAGQAGVRRQQLLRMQPLSDGGTSTAPEENSLAKSH